MPRFLTMSLTELLGKKGLYLVLAVSVAWLGWMAVQANAESGGRLASILFLGY